MINRVLPRSCLGVRRYNAFTLIELIVVVGIIAILSALVLSTVGYARKKGAFARAETEIAAISAACESYKADNGVYPSSSATNTLNARTMFDPQVTDATAYKTASLVLYRAISGDRNLDRAVNATDGNFDIDGSALTPPPSQPQAPRSYFTFKPNMLNPADQTVAVQYVSDAFGNSYGYSTIQAATQDTTKGYNPTFDLWSTAAGTASTDTAKWIKNW